MRLLLLVFFLLTSFTLVLYSPVSSATKIKKSDHAVTHLLTSVQSKKGLNKREGLGNLNVKHDTRPLDVWDRIRMGMQLYSLTDKFIFESKGEIEARSIMTGDIYQLLKEPAVQMRLYKFQRYNINALKGLLKQSPPQIIKNSGPMHYAVNKKGKHPKIFKAIGEIATAEENSHKQVSNVEPEVCNKKNGGVRLAKIVFHERRHLRSVVFLPDTAEISGQKTTSQSDQSLVKTECSKNVSQPSRSEQKPSSGLKSILYAIKTPNPAQQHIANSRIHRQIEWFTKRPDYLQMVAERARPFLFHIVEELARHKLPLELALLPIVESAYKPTAQSPVRAAGLWQFMPSTGKAFNLKQTGFYDDRLDVTASTRAAIRFLSQLNKHYQGDWLLALAAYNCGPGRVDVARRQNQALGLPTDYWSLVLPEETQNYVPRLLALANIFANPAHFKIKVNPIKNEPYFIKVNIEGKAEARLANQDLKTVAQLANLSYENFMRLNPGFLNSTLDKKGPFNFIMPVGNAFQLQRHLDIMASNELDQIDMPYFMNASYRSPEISSSKKL